MDKSSIALGLQIGRILAGQRRTRVPVAYLYNGVRLPPLPEWDREAYPYAVILQYTSRMYKVWATEEQPYVSGSYLRFSGVSFTWVNQNANYEYVNEWVAEGEISAGYSQHASMLVWSNTDVDNTDDGTLYLAASDPIPVYE